MEYACASRWAFALVMGAALASACNSDPTSTGDDDDSSAGGNNPGTGGMVTTAGGGTGGTAGTGGASSASGGMGGDGGATSASGGMGGSATGGMGGSNTGGSNTGGSNTGGQGGQGGTPIVNCNTGSDCNAAEVCDVGSEQCVASQCNPALTQPGGCVGIEPVCVEQLESSGYGACYESCDPYDQGCPGGLECLTNTYGQWFGLCQNAGTGLKGQACSPPGFDANGWTISTGCVAGHVCLEDQNMMPKCYQACDFFSFGSASCPGTEVCQLGGLCFPPTSDGFENVALEAPCNGATGGEYCGLNGDGYTGACNDLFDGLGMVCHAFCSAGDPTACPGTHSVCYEVFAAPFAGDVGACSIP